MTAPADPQLLLDQAVSRLTGPGGPFEIVEEEVLGTVMPVMKNRGHAIGELISASRGLGRRRLSRHQRPSDFLHRARRRGRRAGDCAARQVRRPQGRSSGNSCRQHTRMGHDVLRDAGTRRHRGRSQRLVGSARGRHTASSCRRPKVLVVDAKRGAALPELPASITRPDHGRGSARTHRANTPAPMYRATDIDEDDPAVILFTSGTSGRPKGALHSHRNVMAVVDYHKYSDAIGAAFTGREYDGSKPSPLRYLLTSPLFHIASLHNLVVPRLATGSAVVMTEGGFDVDKVLGLVERERVTNWGAVPTMASRLLEHGNIGKYDVSSLTAFSLASAPSSPAFKERLKEQVPFARNALVDSYGLTECSTAIAVAVGAELEEFPGTLGRPIITVSHGDSRSLRRVAARRHRG